MSTIQETRNNYVLRKILENETEKDMKAIQELKKIYPGLSDEIYLELYRRSISLHQSRNQKNGSFLEKIVGEFLDKDKIPYKEQVTIDQDGNIVGFHLKKEKCYHIIDFVIGENISIGDSITQHTVISCKTTCRERWTQDDWSFKFQPKLYILLTISCDYPPKKRFRESNTRKIISCSSKEKDEREFKLNFDDLISEII